MKNRLRNFKLMNHGRVRLEYWCSKHCTFFEEFRLNNGEGFTEENISGQKLLKHRKYGEASCPKCGA